MSATPSERDLDLLAACGLPLARRGAAVGLLPADTLDAEALGELVMRVARELDRGPAGRGDARIREAFAALLLAIRGHYPTRFHDWARREPRLRELVPEEPTGRMIKLSRIARGPLARIL